MRRTRTVKLSVHDQRHPGPAVDIRLGTVAADACLGELLADLAARFPHRLGGPGGAAILIDGRPAGPREPLIGGALRSGSQVVLRDGRTPLPAAGPGRPWLVELARVAGPDSGSSVGLEAGTFAIGRTARPGLTGGRVARPAVRLEVSPGGAALVGPADVDTGELRIDGRAAPEARAAPAGTLITLGDTAFRLRPRPPGRPPGGEPDGSGRLPLLRTPRVGTPPPPSEVVLPDLPGPAARPQRPSWLLMLAPLPIGMVMALVFSPLFLLMTAMTPVMALARWAENRRDTARLAAGSARAARDFAAGLATARDAVEAAARAGHADLAELRHRAATGRRLWQVRPGDADELRVTVGLATLPWHPELRRAGGPRPTGSATPAALAAVPAEYDHLVDVPVQVDLLARTGLGVVGPPGIARAVARTAVLDLTVRHGPADLALALLAEPARLPDWEWAKWLPQLAGDDGIPRVATDPDTAATLLADLTELTGLTGPAAGVPPHTLRTRSSSSDSPRTSGVRHVVVVIDGDGLLTGRVAALLGRLARGAGRAVVVAGRPERLPAVCTGLIHATATGTATVTDAATGRTTPGVLLVQAAPGACLDTARALSGWSDPEQTGTAATLPDRIRLLDLLARTLSMPDLTAPAITARWCDPAPGLRATLGADATTPVTVDLLTDGPHGLVAGTTGAGTSELLRTLVASLACTRSPDDLTFLLVDVEGGGTFDACAGLPHTVGLVTGLDEHLATRALRCLRAELRHRERRLREAGVSDLRDHPAPSPPLPRLVIVVDEFASLAAELPGFLSALVDVAQQGSSLGIHLILATRRPQGVVDAKIRSGTNLRIALRVRDEAGSRAVLGTRQAADIDRRHPGRAFARLGAGDVIAFQTALVSGPAPRPGTARIDVGPFGLLPTPDDAAPPPGDGRTDLENLVATTARAAADGGYRPPRTPYPAPLPDHLDAWTLPAPRPRRPGEPGESWVDPAEPGAAGAVPLGLVDLPDEQRVGVWWWRPADGGTVVLGADPADAAAVLASACLGLARVRAPDAARIVVLDGLGHGLRELSALPQVIAAVRADDGERTGRVLDLLDAELAGRRAADTGSPDLPVPDLPVPDLPDQPVPDLLVVVAGWATVVDGAERAGLADPGGRLERLLRDGPALGVRMLISAAHERGLPARVLARLPTRLCLRLADPGSYTGLGLAARDVPDLRGLHALELTGRAEVLIGRYGNGSAASTAEAAATLATRHPGPAPTGPDRAPGVGVLPELIPAAEVLPAGTADGEHRRLVIGLNYRDAVVCVLTPAPGDWQRAVRDATVTEAVASIDELTAWPAAGWSLLLVDDVDSLGAEAATLDRLLTAVHTGAHLAVAGRPDAFRGMRAWQRAVALSRTGLLLRPDPDDGDLLRIRLPRGAPVRAVPGRGYLVLTGSPEQAMPRVFAGSRR